MTTAFPEKTETESDPEHTGQTSTRTAGLRSDGELVQAGGDEFHFVGTSPDDGETEGFLAPAICGVVHEGRRVDTDDGGAGKTISTPSKEYEAHDDTPYDDDVPKEFRVADPPPPPFDKEDDDDSLPDTITWTNVGDGAAKAGGSGDYDDFLPLMSFDPTSLPPTSGDGPPYLDVNGDGTEVSTPAMTDDFIWA